MDLNNYKDYCSSINNNLINSRIYNRNLPSKNLQPYLSVRPCNSKYADLPIIEQRIQSKEKLINESTFNIYQNFNPGNDFSPWSGYSSNINKENELRNQLYAIQTCPQSQYIPSSNSDLYKLKCENNNKNINQPFTNLFKEENYNKFNTNPDDNIIGVRLFNNATRQQIKDITFNQNKNIC